MIKGGGGGISVAEPQLRFFCAAAGADILGLLQLLFLASEKRNDLKMLIFLSAVRSDDD